MDIIRSDLSKNVIIFSELLEKKNDIENYGLLNGYMGMSIICYLLSKHTGDKLFAKKGLDLLEWICDTGVTVDNLSFANGLTGIGWSIEWLVQNELLNDTNTNEILEPIDTILYKIVSYERDVTLSLSNGLLGKIAYFLKRISSRNPNTHRYKTIGHLECLVLLTDDLSEKMDEVMTVSDQNKPIMKQQELESIIDLCDLGEIIVEISAIKVNLNSPTLGKILFDSINYTEQILSNPEIYFPSAIKAKEKKYFDYLYLAVCYLTAAKNKNNKYWESQAVNYIEKIVFGLDDGFMVTTEQLFQKLSIYSLMNFYCPKDNYKHKIEQLIVALSKEMPPGLFNGRGALIIAELCMANPGLIKNWQEIIFYKRT